MGFGVRPPAKPRPPRQRKDPTGCCCFVFRHRIQLSSFEALSPDAAMLNPGIRTQGHIFSDVSGSSPASLGRACEMPGGYSASGQEHCDVGVQEWLGEAPERSGLALAAAAAGPAGSVSGFYLPAKSAWWTMCSRAEVLKHAEFTMALPLQDQMCSTSSPPLHEALGEPHPPGLPLTPHRHQAWKPLTLLCSQNSQGSSEKMLRAHVRLFPFCSPAVAAVAHGLFLGAIRRTVTPAVPGCPFTCLDLVRAGACL